MAKARKSPCIYCDENISIGVSFCTRCGKPTEWASHDQRVEYELRQWGNSPRAAAKTRKTATIVSTREVAEATTHVPSPLLRSAPPVREEKPVRKVALHPMAAKVRRAESKPVPEPAPTVIVNILPSPRQRKIAIKRHERPSAAPATQTTTPEPVEEARVATEPEMRDAPKDSPKKVTMKAARAPKPAVKKTEATAKKTATKAVVKQPAAKTPIAKKPAAKKAPARRVEAKTAKDDVVIDLTKATPAEPPTASETQMVALVERQVELLSEIAERLGVLEEKMTPKASSTGKGSSVEPIASGNGHSNGRKHRRFWFAKR